MRFILIILLFPVFCSAQFGAGVAYCSADNATKFGVLVNSTTLSNSQKADITKDSLGCNWARTGLTVQTWSGSSGRIEIYQSKDIKQIAVINADAGVPNPFVSSSRLSTYADTVRLMLVKYPYLYGVCVENEEINPNYHSGPLADWVLMCQAVYNVAHPLGIKVYDGGIYGGGLYIKVYRYLQSKYGQATADLYGAMPDVSGQSLMTNAQINAAKTINSNPTLEAKANQIDTVFTAAPYVDGFILHAYEPNELAARPDTITQIRANYLRFTKEFIESITHKPCITNETCARNNVQPNLVTNMLNEYLRLGFMIVQWFNGEDPLEGSKAITDDVTGNMLATGQAFRNFITTHQ